MIIRNDAVQPRPDFGPQFSWLELVIFASIGLALFGVSVPMFQKGTVWCPRAEARMDLDVIRNAIALYEQQNGRLYGTNLVPLMGRYLQEPPRDPWGRAYIIAADAGLVITFGADGRPGGTDEDADIMIEFDRPSY